MRRILPRRSFALEADFWESQAERPGRSSMGAKPSDSKGLVLSPIDTKRQPSGPKASEPPEWQHWSRCVGTCKRIFSEDGSRPSPSIVKRDKCCSGVEPLGE